MNFTFRKLQGKQEGHFDFNGNQYIYNLYLQPLSKKNQNEVIAFFGNRKTYNASTQRDESCLNTNADDIREYLAPDNNYNIWAFGKVWLHKEGELNDDIASGTLQIVDQLIMGKDQYWISDVCRTRDNDKEKSKISPIPALFYLFEQLILQKKGETKIWLMVDAVEDRADPPSILENIYTKYGFHKEPDNLQRGEITYKIMYKNIEPVESINTEDESIEHISKKPRIGGYKPRIGGYKINTITSKKTSKKTLKKKTRKNK
jgi:hypothetical protein